MKTLRTATPNSGCSALRAEVYEDYAYRWWWRLVARDGGDLGRSERSYSSVKAARLASKEQNPDVRVEVIPWHLPQ